MRQDIEFDAEGVTLRGWLYLPDGASGPVATVVMAHGFSAVKEMYLDSFAEAFTKLLSEVPQAIWDIKTTIYEGDVLLLEWGAEGGGNRVEDGVDTFVFRDGLIRVQTVRYTLQPAP